MANYRIYDNVYGGAGTGAVTGHLSYPNFGTTGFSSVVDTEGAANGVPSSDGYDTSISTGGWKGYHSALASVTTNGTSASGAGSPTGAGSGPHVELAVQGGYWASITQKIVIREDLSGGIVTPIINAERTVGSGSPCPLDINIFTWDGSTKTDLLNETTTMNSSGFYPETGGSENAFDISAATWPAAGTTVYVRLKVDTTTAGGGGDATTWRIHYCDLATPIPVPVAQYTCSVADDAVLCEGSTITCTNTSTNDGVGAGGTENVSDTSPTGDEAVASAARWEWFVDSTVDATGGSVTATTEDLSHTFTATSSVATGSVVKNIHLKTYGYQGFNRTTNAAATGTDNHLYSTEGEIQVTVRPLPEWSTDGGETLRITSGDEGISPVTTNFAGIAKWLSDKDPAQKGGGAITGLMDGGSTGVTKGSETSSGTPEVTETSFTATKTCTNSTTASTTVSTNFTLQHATTTGGGDPVTLQCNHTEAAPNVTVHPDIAPVAGFTVPEADKTWYEGSTKLLNITNTTLSGNAATSGSNATVTAGRCASNTIGHTYKFIFQASTAEATTASNSAWDGTVDLSLSTGTGPTTVSIPNTYSAGTYKLAMHVTDVDGDESVSYITYTISTFVNEFVLRAYTSEANALSDSSSIDLDGGNGELGMQTQSSGDGFFLYERYFFRIQANEPCSEFYIDWDDGEDNLENANASKIKNDTPRVVGVTSHIFTKHGNHYPKLRVRSTDGFLSKFYTPYHASNDVSSIDEDFSVSDAGTQNYSMVYMEKLGQPHIPIFQPANKPPLGVLKMDRKEVYAGIDNDNLTSGTIKVVSTGLSTTTVSITYKDAATGVIKNVSGKKHNDTVANVEYILEVRLDNLLESAHTNTYDRLYVTDNSTAADICNVSLGFPIVKLNEPNFTVIADGAESLARASNVSISNYYFDTDKLIDVDDDGDYIQASATGSGALGDYNTSDIFQIGTASGAAVSSKYTKSQIKLNYSNERVEHVLNTDYRYLPQERLIRLQVLDDSSSTRTDTVGDKIEYSFVEHFRNNNHTGNYIDTTGTGKAAIRPSSLQSEGLLLFANKTSSTTWLDLEAKNRDYNTDIIVGDEDASGSVGNEIKGSGVTDTKNFLLVGKTDKFNRLFMRMNHTVTNTGTTLPVLGTSIPAMRLGLYYPADVAGVIKWKPLSFIDTTRYDDTTKDTSLHRSGHIMWETPEDWAKVMGNGTEDTKAGLTEVAQGGGFVDANPATWDFNAYTILVTLASKYDHSFMDDIKIANVWPYNNSHSQVIKIIDPTHISINSVGISKDITFGRTGKTITLENRFGKSDIKKIGSSGGQVGFGMRDLGTSDYNNMKGYQQDGTPVYLDVTHKNDDVTRFYGLIDNLSETHPTGKGLVSIQINLTVSHIIELDSSGSLLSDGYIALGGDAGDKAKYIL